MYTNRDLGTPTRSLDLLPDTYIVNDFPYDESKGTNARHLYHIVNNPNKNKFVDSLGFQPFSNTPKGTNGIKEYKIV